MPRSMTATVQPGFVGYTRHLGYVRHGPREPGELGDWESGTGNAKAFLRHESTPRRPCRPR